MRSKDPFAELGIPARFDVSPRELRAAWMRQAALSHPDAAGAVEESARVNEAMRVLSDPILRAHALLALRGAAGVEAPKMQPSLLLEMVELRERADTCAHDGSALAELRAEAVARRDAAITDVTALFAAAPEGALDPACLDRILAELNTIRAFDRMLEQLDREAGDPGDAS
jgi:molecular chaperone HscB